MIRKRFALLMLALSTASFFAAESSSLTFLKAIPLPGVTGRFDHFAIDLKGHRLFVAALGNKTLEAIDLAAGRQIKSIPSLGKLTGVLFLPGLSLLFVACGDDPIETNSISPCLAAEPRRRKFGFFK